MSIKIFVVEKKCVHGPDKTVHVQGAKQPVKVRLAVIVFCGNRLEQRDWRLYSVGGYRMVTSNLLIPGIVIIVP